MTADSRQGNQEFKLDFNTDRVDVNGVFEIVAEVEDDADYWGPRPVKKVMFKIYLYCNYVVM